MPSESCEPPVRSITESHATPFHFRRALRTDKYLRVRGTEGIFALGDCSTIEHELMIKRAEELFTLADVDGDKTLTYDEFLALMETAKRKYPQVQVELAHAEKDCKR